METLTALVDQAMHTLVDNAKDAIFVLDTHGKMEFMNRKAEEITGKSKAELQGKPFESIIKEKGKISPVTLLEPVKVLVTVETPQGDFPAEIFFKPAVKNGTRTGILSIMSMSIKNVEKIRSLEEVGIQLQKLSAVQSIYKTLGEELSSRNCAFVLFLFDKNHLFIENHNLPPGRVNAAEANTRLSLSEVFLSLKLPFVKKIRDGEYFYFSTIFSFAHSTDHSKTARVRTLFQQAGFSQGVAVPLAIENTPTGILVFLSEEMKSDDAPVFYRLGVQVSAALERAAHFEQLDRDLKTLQEQSDFRTRELEKVKSLMESIIQSSVDAIIATDLDGRITFVNKGVETMFGYTKSEIVGELLMKYYAGGKKETKKHKRIILRKGKLENEEFDFLAKDNQVVHALASLSLLKDKKGNVTGFMGVFKDITEQKRLQQTLDLLNRTASRIQKSRTRDEIFTITAEELKLLGFYVAFILFDEGKTTGQFVCITEEKKLASLEALRQVLLSPYQFPLDKVMYKDLLERREALYIADLESVLGITFPDVYNTYKEELTNSGITIKKAIVAPLVSQGDVVGILAVLSEGITEKDNPSIHVFANQVSTALENARLLEERQKRACELEHNVDEQQSLRELNTELFEAQSEEEVLDAAIEGIHRVGKSFSAINLHDGEDIAAIRMEMGQKILKTVRKVEKRMNINIMKYYIFVEGTIYSEFFRNQIPLITSNIEVDIPVLRAEISEICRRIVFGSKSLNVISVSFPFVSAMVFPIVVGGATVGALTVASRKVFVRKDFDMMGMIAEMVSGAMERIRQSKKVVETSSELRAIQRINTLLNMGASLDSILAQVSANIKEVYHYEFVFPLLLESSRRYLTFKHVTLPSRLLKKVTSVLGVDLVNFKYPIHEDISLFKTVIEEKRCIIRKGFKEMADEIPIKRIKSPLKVLSPVLSRGLGLEHDGSIMVAPLPCGEEVIGVLLLGHRKSLTEEDFNRLEYFLDQVGIAIAKSEVERKLRHSLEELRELDRMKSEFINTASHELRTPLTTLKLYLEMMVREQYGRLSPALKDRIHIMQEGVNRLEEIINQTLVASRLIKNKLELEEEQVSLLEVAGQVIHRLHPLWKAKNQRISIDTPPELSEVEGDKRALSTVLDSLVDNAIRYSPENTDILVKFVEYPTEVECMVIDEGCGISPHHREKIFEEFYIVPSETEYARMDGRTGLGLFIVKGIIERHKGRIWVESDLGKGSTFHFVIPKRLKA
ncbi:MAG: PAS domain S-box protein [Theionarchaea archaeon]|nr:PAS domain S-box protein [Theionarchaea archaeon]